MVLTGRNVHASAVRHPRPALRLQCAANDKEDLPMDGWNLVLSTRGEELVMGSRLS